MPAIILVKMSILGFIFLGTTANEEPEGSDTHIPEGSETLVSAGYTAVNIPDTVSFAGEPVPVWRYDIRESLDRELLVNSYFHSQTIRFLKVVPRYFSVIEPILKERGIPDDFKYLALAESGFNPRALSPASAAGIWQFLQGTAREFGLEVNKEVDERYHLEKSTYAACDYLWKAYQKYESWAMVAAAYNGGMAGVERQMNRQKNNSYYDILFGEETGRYLFRIIALKLIMENPENYNFYIAEDERYPIVPAREIVITGKIENFADFAIQQGINYKLLKDLNPWLRDNFLTNTGGKSYTVKIPLLERY